MSEIKNHKFHSTGQFRNVVKNIKHQAQFKGVDESGVAVMDRTAIAPTLKYIGTTKLHGTNGSIVLHENGVVSFHSKSQLLGYVKDGEFTLNSDNAEFSQTMYRRWDGVSKTLACAVEACKAHYGKVIYPIKVSGEWCGQGIQKSVGISMLPVKSFFVFGVKCGETNQEKKQGWLKLDLLHPVCSNEHHIYNIMNFPTASIEINFNEPEFAQNKLVEYTESVENECPVSKSLGVTETLLGEGLVWIPEDPDYGYDSGNWFKTKGQKHSVSKVKSVAAVNPEKLNSIKAFVEYAVTENRLEQGLGEVGLDQKSIGKFIGWVNKDINKEEGDVLESNNLSMKEVGKNLSDKARIWYIEQLNKDL